MGKKMSSSAAAQLLSVTLYYRRFFPYYAFNMIAGLDENGKYKASFFLSLSALILFFRKGSCIWLRRSWIIQARWLWCHGLWSEFFDAHTWQCGAYKCYTHDECHFWCVIFNRSDIRIDTTPSANCQLKKRSLLRKTSLLWPQREISTPVIQ